MPALLLSRVWPDGVDLSMILCFLTIGVGVPVAGCVLMWIDWRKQFRRLRRALVLVSQYPRILPEWVRNECPPCVAVFELRMPFSEQELLAAYRTKVKKLHPDRGGDRKRFLQLQRSFEQAMQLVEERPRSRSQNLHV